VNEDQLKIFISVMRQYFEKVTGSRIEVGVPFLKDESSNVLLSYTGVIGISGKMKGAIYITADEDLITELINYIAPKKNLQKEDFSSMIGELANTIAGNAQKTLGPEFHISIPIILTKDKSGTSSSIIIKAPTFIFPLKWSEKDAFLAVGLLSNG
jgi:chemotaxis protein CheX